MLIFTHLNKRNPYSDVIIVSNHQPHDCLLNRLFRCRSKKTSKLRVTGLCAGNSPVTGAFLEQRASKAEKVSVRWLHHGHSPVQSSHSEHHAKNSKNVPLNYLSASSVEYKREPYPRSVNRPLIVGCYCLVDKLRRNIRIVVICSDLGRHDARVTALQLSHNAHCAEFNNMMIR